MCCSSTASENVPQTIKEALGFFDDVRLQQGNNAKAYLLHKNHNVKRQALYSDPSKICSNGGISRAKKALQSGFDPCIPGRHKKLNLSDEQTLESWVLELIDLGETVYTSTLIQLVYFVFPFIIF